MSKFLAGVGDSANPPIRENPVMDTYYYLTIVLMGNDIVSKSLGFDRRACWLKESTRDWVALI